MTLNKEQLCAHKRKVSARKKQQKPGAGERGRSFGGQEAASIGVEVPWIEKERVQAPFFVLSC